MKTSKFVSTLILVSLIMVLVASALSSRAFPVQAQNENSYEVMFSIPIGDNGVHYEGVDIPEALTWGPAALTVSTEGDIWIADTAGNGLLRYSPKGEFLGKIDLSGLAVGTTDLIVNKDIVLVLDQASQPPKVLRMDMKGNILGSFDLPKGLYLEDGLTGIAQGNNGDLLIEREFGASVTQFLDNKGVPTKNVATDGFIQNGKLYSAHISGLASANPKHGEIDIAGKKIGVDTTNELGGLQILGFGSIGDVYVIVEELAQSPALQVDQTIRHYDAEGNLLGTARMPIDEQYTYVAQDFAIGPDGNLYALVTRPDRVDIVRLNFYQKLDPILISKAVKSDISYIKNRVNSTLTCVTRDTMISTAQGYLNNSKYLSSTNTDGSCAGRTKPHYIIGAGTYSSVPYDYGGFDSVSSYNGYMSPGTSQAGDADSTEETNPNCAKGVDCSGYVSRAWQLTGKLGTCGLEGVSTQLSSTSQLLRGDIMNNCGVHTVIFSGFNGSTGFYDYESTTMNNYDRVISYTSTWSRVSSYLPRRYTNVCP
jgi:hypothetical protein